MRRIFLIVSLVACLSFFGYSQISKNRLKQEAQERVERQQRQKQEKARQNAEAREREENYYYRIVDNWDPEIYQVFLNEYSGSKYANSEHIAEIKARMTEIALWNNAVHKNTVNSYNSYLAQSKYHRYDSETHDALERLKAAEINAAWDKACEQNTIEAYEEFIETYPDCSKSADADTKIKGMKAQRDWDIIKESTGAPAFEHFISNYPDSPHVEEATKKLYLIYGLDNYYAGNYEGAYRYFSQFKESDITDNYRNAYNKTMEEHTFGILNAGSPLSELEEFLRKYPYSSHKTDVNNYIALNKAHNFNYYSTKTDYEEAMRYATNDSTLQQVKEMVSNNKKSIKEYDKAQKRAKRYDNSSSYNYQSSRSGYTFMTEKKKENGGFFRMGIELMDLGYNCREEENGMGRYDVGLKFRFGNYADRLQASFGVKAGLLVQDLSEISDANYYFELPLEADLKMNLCKAGDSTWWYLYGRYKYNAIRPDDLLRPMAWGVGTGFAGKNCEFTIYYEKEFGGNDYRHYLFDKANGFIGMSLAVYWRLW